jgi:predicted nucleic acid-binding protein
VFTNLTISIEEDVVRRARELARKREVAREVIRAAFRERAGVLSTQVLSEYFVDATRKLGIQPGRVRRGLEVLLSMEVVRIEPETILDAIDLHRLHGFSPWDCLVLECAAVSGCSSLCTEELQHGQTVRGVRIVDPFRE